MVDRRAPSAAALLLAAAAAAEELLRPGTTDTSVTARLLLAFCGTLPVAFARTQVLAATAVVTSATALLLVLEGGTSWAVMAAQVLVAYLLARHGPGPAATVLAMGCVAVALVALLSSGTGVAWEGPAPTGQGTAEPDAAGPGFEVGVAAATLSALCAGWLRRARREAVDRRASQRALAESALQHTARGERARIARELHDVVAHHLSMISVQAETARLTTPGLPQEGADRMQAIGDTARAALTEMRRLLGVLREDAHLDTSRRPQPGVDDLGDLLAEARDAGTPARMVVSGPARPLDPGTQLTAYRIIQEALTNARRHAPGASVEVALAYADDGVRVTVADHGPGATEDALSAGHGLLGIHERVAMVGGTLGLGPGVNGGLVVDAFLPTSVEGSWGDGPHHGRG